MIDVQRVGAWAEEHGIDADPGRLADLDRFAEEVCETNKLFNLTAITDPEDMEVRNIIDSLSVIPFIPEGASVADVGTGAGFPGMVIAIMRGDADVSLIEATNKKLEFALRTAQKLGRSVRGYHMRSEEAARSALRGSFDVVTARAVAALPVLLEYTLPLLKEGGRLLAMKGPAAEEETEASKRALKELKGHIEAVHPVLLPGGEKRNIVEVVLDSECPEKYPRASGAIKKKPL